MPQRHIMLALAAGLVYSGSAKQTSIEKWTDVHHRAQPRLRAEKRAERREAARARHDFAALGEELFDDGAAEPLRSARHDRSPAIEAPVAARHFSAHFAISEVAE